jgi:hypothetical protein
MALVELYTNDLCLYTVEPRKNKTDEYTQRKIQKDRTKLYTWITELLKQNEIVLFYKEDGVEKNCICTIRGYEDKLPNAPLSSVHYRGDDFVQLHYLRVIDLSNGRIPKIIHIDDVTKFILKNDNVSDIAQELYYQKK